MLVAFWVSFIWSFVVTSLGAQLTLFTSLSLPALPFSGSIDSAQYVLGEHESTNSKNPQI